MLEKLLEKRIACIILLVLAVTASHIHVASAESSESPASGLLITEVYANTMMKGEPDEFIALQNFGECVNISGWSISDGEGTIIFPNFTVQPHQKIYIVRNASAFEAQASELGVKLRADFEWTNSSEHALKMRCEGRFALRNDGDEVVLRNERGEVVDVLVFGDVCRNCDCEGWHGSALQKPPESYVFKRKSRDTDTKYDWVLTPVHSPVHTYDNLTFYIREACAFVSPDCSFDIVAGEISNATSYILINTYEFDNFALKDALKNAIKRGVDVKILIEHTPIGGMSDNTVAIMNELSDSGSEIRLLKLTRAVNHAKYAVIDGESVIVMSENMKNSGIPKAKVGNRGYGVVLRGKKLAKFFETLFYSDFNRAERYEPAVKFAANAFPSANDRAMKNNGAEWMHYIPIFKPFCVRGDENIKVIPLVGPDNALDAMLNVFNNAEKRIYVELFSSEKIWDDGNSCNFVCLSDKNNPLLNALINAARRGCDVKVLLDGKEYNLEGDNDNDEVVKWLNDVADRENISIEAKIADLNALKLLKIHSKCAVIDDKVLISSMNWKSGATCNREAGVIVESRNLADYYVNVFMHDWNLSAGEIADVAEAPVSGGKSAGASEETENVLVERVLGVALAFASAFAVFLIIKRYRY